MPASLRTIRDPDLLLAHILPATRYKLPAPGARLAAAFLTLIRSNDHLGTMARVSTAPKSPTCPEEAVFVDLVRTADLLSRAPAQLLKSHDLSPNQYNVLRILRGAPDGLLCGEIACRMISRDPDITRLLDRLEKRGLIGRCRENPDRRKVFVRITPAGLALLDHLHDTVCETHHRQLGHLTPRQLQQLSRLLAAARQAASLSHP